MESTVRLTSTNNAKIVEDGTQLTDLVDFIIPSGNTYNLSKSYIAMKFRLSNAPTDHVADFILTSNEAVNNKIPPALVNMVKNVNVFAERAGKIEDIRAVNLLRAVLNNHTDDRDKVEMLSNPFAVRDHSNTYCNPFVLKKNS